MDSPPAGLAKSEIAALRARQKVIKASPLRKNTLLPFNLPSIYPESTYSPDQCTSESPNPPRQSSESLLALLGANSRRTLSLKLVKGIEKKLSVWRAHIDVEGRKRKVVVKLHVDSGLNRGEWDRGTSTAEREAAAYRSFRSTQGVDVPICYGFFNFSAPWNETIVGVILEDLSKVSTPLSCWAASYLTSGEGFDGSFDSDDERRARSSPESEAESEDESERRTRERQQAEEAVRKAEELKKFILRLHEGQRRLHDREHQVLPDKNDILVLRSSTLVDPHFVFTGFKSTYSKLNAEKVLKEELAVMETELKDDFGEDETLGFSRDFRDWPERRLRGEIKHLFGDHVEHEWRKFGLFDYVGDV